MNKQSIVFCLTAIAFMTVATIDPTLAQTDGSDVGQNFFQSLQGMIVGNIGFFLGLLLAVWGIWVWVVQQKTGAGVMMIIGGVLITLAPGLFNSIRGLADQALGTVGAEDTSAGFTVNPN